jgi:NADH:ubiquinone oxidoreductase subunit
VGTDAYGNKYFEKKDAILNRDRWVVFANSTHYTGQNPTVVPPEWHGWLHFITDDNPTTVRFDFFVETDYVWSKVKRYLGVVAD